MRVSAQRVPISTSKLWSRMSVSRGMPCGSRTSNILFMSRITFAPGDEVVTSRGRGIIIDVQATPSGKFVFGVEDTDGEVTYFTPKALTHA